MKLIIAIIQPTKLSAVREALEKHAPRLVLLSVPFPGSVYGAFRIAQALKQKRPDITIVLGGGYANTELRRISDDAAWIEEMIGAMPAKA